MSQENVEIVRRTLDGFNARDLDALVRNLDPEVELDWSRSRGVEAGVYRGREASRDFWANFLDMFDPMTVTADEFIEWGDHVVVPNRARLVGRDGVEVTARSVFVASLRDGHIVRWCLYQQTAEAFEAVGLGE